MIFIASLVCFVGAFLSFIIASVISNSNLNYYLLSSSILFLLVVFLSKIEYLKTARIIFLLVFNFVITFLSSYFGKESSVEFFLIFAIGLPFALFSFTRKKNNIVIFCFIPFLCWLLLYFTDFELFIDIEQTNTIKTKNIVYSNYM